MKKRTILISLVLVLCLLLLAGCGRKKKAPVSPLPAGLPVSPAPAAEAEPTPVPEYNTISSADKAEIRAVREELLSVAEACREVYDGAEKSSALNAVLPDGDYYAMVARIGSLGCAATDSTGRWDMEGAEGLAELCRMIGSGSDCAGTYYVVYPDGQISAYHLSRRLGEWHLITMSLGWKKGEPEIYSQGQFVISDVQYTDKGWLIYNRDTGSFDDNQRSNTTSWVFVRVQPCDSVKKELCRKYVEPIGYFENNLFTTTWSRNNPGPIDFNSLYAYLFGMYHGTEMLSSYNIHSYYTNLPGTDLYMVPRERFEEVVQYYFDISSASLINISDFNSAAGGYFFLGYQSEYYNVTPRTPEPEVTDYWYNADGSLTLRVDAVNKWYGTDRAFTHELTVAEYGDGHFMYLGNTLIDRPENILPENKLCYLLDLEREKTPYKKA